MSQAITKEQIIEMIEALQAKQKAAKQVLKNDTLIESRAHTERYIRNLGSVCDRLAFNFNAMQDHPEAANFLSNTIAEAELFLEKQA